MYDQQMFSLEFAETTSTKIVAIVKIAPAFVALFYEHALSCYALVAQAPGFRKGSVPRDYIERNYTAAILNQLEHFLFVCYVEPFLFYTLRKKSIALVGKPKLISVQLSVGSEAIFRFSCMTLPCQASNQWRHTNFRAPARKNYRDLDNQVISFLTEELGPAKTAVAPTISPEDWIGFELKPSIIASAEALFPVHFWLRIGNEDPDHEACQLFANRESATCVTTQARFLQDYFQAAHETQYTFNISITHHISHKLFCLDLFKKHFKLRSEKDVHRKLIEVFSYRNDISQRRETAEAVLKIIIKQNPFQVPFDLIAEERERIVANMMNNPDYYVYKSQSDFQEKVDQLAQKQIKEAALIDAIAYSERIEVTDQDIAGYLNLLKRPRMKEFIYFELPDSRMHEREIPLPREMVYRTCLREKTLNTIIHTLTRSSL